MLRIVVVFAYILVARIQLNVLVKFLIGLVALLFILFVQIIDIKKIILNCFVGFFFASYFFTVILNFILLILLLLKKLITGLYSLLKVLVDKKFGPFR